jgi:DNA-binding XRE family transcriptional regulator
MSLKLTAAQCAYLRSQPATELTKVALALRIAGANRRQFAQALGITPQAVSAMLRGDIRISTAHRIAAVFGCNLDDLFPPPPSVVDRRTPKKLATRSTSKVKSSPSKAPKARVAA